MKPLAIDLYAGLGGWAGGLLAEGFDVIGFDIERHIYGEHRYPAQLVIQDVRTLHGSQFKSARLIVASPPCQEFSYMAMPWTLGKAKAAAIRADESGTMAAKLTELFNACFRIQREACEAAGRHIPLIIENVRGSQPWVGRARWSYGSYYLWGDVPALMPITTGGFKSRGMNWSDQTKRGQDFTRVAGKQAMEGIKVGSGRHENGSCNQMIPNHIKNNGGSWFAVAHNKASGLGNNPVNGRKGDGGSWFGEYRPGQGTRNLSSDSLKRKQASAMIAKIPEPLSRHIARTFRP